jgi:hypothetical protein
MPGRLINRRPSLNGIQKLCDPIFCLLVCKKTIKHIYIYIHTIYIYGGLKTWFWRIEKWRPFCSIPKASLRPGYWEIHIPPHDASSYVVEDTLEVTIGAHRVSKGGNLRNELVEFAKSSKFLLI